MAMLGLGDQIAEFNELDRGDGGQRAPAPRLFRPPYASFNADTIELLDHRRLLMVLWSVDTGDYLDPGSEVIADARSTASSRARSILLHDGGGDRAETIAALPKIIQGLPSATRAGDDPRAADLRPAAARPVARAALGHRDRDRGAAAAGRALARRRPGYIQLRCASRT